MRFVKYGTVILSIIVLLVQLVYAQNNIFSWEGTILDANDEGIPLVHIQVNGSSRHYLFVADEKGYASIRYSSPSLSDSVIISSIGYATIKLHINELKGLSSVGLQSLSYELNGVEVKPQKPKMVTLGNKKSMPIGYAQVGFESQNVLYVPNPGLRGTIMSVNIYMSDISRTAEWRYRPFRLRLYEGSPIGEKELIEEEIVAVLPKGKDNWVTINLSHLNIYLPEKGIGIAVEALPFQYYLEQGYIDKEVTEEGQVNSIAVGWSFDGIYGNRHLESWTFYKYRGWEMTTTKNNYLYRISIKLIK